MSVGRVEGVGSTSHAPACSYWNHPEPWTHLHSHTEMPWQKEKLENFLSTLTNNLSFWKHIHFLAEQLSLFYPRYNCIQMTGEGRFIKVCKMLEKASRKKRHHASIRHYYHLFESLFGYWTSPLGTYRSAGLIISKAVCSLSWSHHLSVEGPSLTDFPNQNKTIHKVLRGTHWG